MSERDLEKNKARLEDLFEKEKTAIYSEEKESIIKHQEALKNLIGTIEERRIKEAEIVQKERDKKEEKLDCLHLVRHQNEKRAKELEKWALDKWVVHDGVCLIAARRSELDPPPSEVRRPSRVRIDGRHELVTYRYQGLAQATRYSFKYCLGLKHQRAGNFDAVDGHWMKRKERYLRWFDLNEESMNRVYDRVVDCINQVRAANRAAAAEAGPSDSSFTGTLSANSRK